MTRTEPRPHPSIRRLWPALAAASALSLFLSAPAASASGDEGQVEAAAEALDWLGAELASNGGSMPGLGPGATDWGLTADAALALLSHGRGADATADALLAAVGAYTTWDDLGAEYAGVRLAGPLAKLLLVTREAGRPGTVGPLDLEAELRGLMADSGPSTGRFADRNPHASDSANTVGQSLAILALSHTAGGAPGDSVDHLISLQCPAGGFPLQSVADCGHDSEADPDATALALDALLVAPRDAEVTGAIASALGWLVSRQDPATGAFGGTGPTAAPNANSSGLIAHALASAGQTATAESAATWIRTELQILATDAGGTPVEGDAGAIAYSPAAREAAFASGIDELSRDQWRRATSQAVLALGADPLGRPVDDPPVEPDPPPSTTTSSTTSSSTTSAPAPADAVTTSTAPAAGLTATSTSAPATDPTTGTPTGETVAAAEVLGASTDSTGGEPLAATGGDAPLGLLLGLLLVVPGSGVVLLGRRVASVGAPEESG